MNSRAKIVSKETFWFFALFAMAILVVYRAPFIINQLFFVVILALAFRSKKDYFWLAFFFLIIDAPGGLFIGGNSPDTHKLAFFNIAPKITIGFSDLYIFLMFLKAIWRGKSTEFIFRSSATLIIIYGIVVFVYSTGLGLTTASSVWGIRILMNWTFLLIIPRFLLSRTEMDKLSALLFPVVILAVISQFYSFSFGQSFADTLNGNLDKSRYLLITTDLEQMSRAAASSFILMYCFINALFYILSRTSVFFRPYLLIIVFLSIFSVFLSATRGWILGYLIVVLLSGLFISKSKIIWFRSLIVALVIFVAIWSLYPKIMIQVNGSIDRLLTLQSMAEGDLTAQGTLARLTERGPLVMEKVSEHPWFGWGFSTEYFEASDKHVGHPNLLLNIGIFGLIFFSLIFVIWCYKIIIVSRNPIIASIYNKGSVLVFLFGFLGMYVIHSSSAQAWGFDISPAHVILYALFLQNVNLISQTKINQKNITNGVETLNNSIYRTEIAYK